ncbi:hypothetical protein BMS3Bbin10_00611 [bacterium BMS3Bbin10]|nr:hypothetical protein BMS3Bbin10_00611 [bacterium BMS3Bbin10]HDL16561.1 aspartate/glutamate racemase family protein [Hyphomicrobiales bacterium]
MKSATLIDGGLNIYGIAIGVLCLESYFAKLPGHIKNATSFDFPVSYKVVGGATVERLLRRPDPELRARFIEAARELERDGVAAITGSCGFLALFQKELADAVDIPVFASSLIQVPMVHRMLKDGQTVGVMTASSKSLTPAHFEAVGAAGVPVSVIGMDDAREFTEVIVEGRREPLDFTKLEQEFVTAAKSLLQQDRQIGAIVLECTDMCSFAASIQSEVGLPVFDLTTLTRMVAAAVMQRHYQGFTPR